jgi:hypothetical protein
MERWHSGKRTGCYQQSISLMAFIVMGKFIVFAEIDQQSTYPDIAG